jgi:hypothetical protein
MKPQTRQLASRKRRARRKEKREKQEKVRPGGTLVFMMGPLGAHPFSQEGRIIRLEDNPTEERVALWVLFFTQDYIPSSEVATLAQGKTKEYAAALLLLPPGWYEKNQTKMQTSTAGIKPIATWPSIHTEPEQVYADLINIRETVGKVSSSS